MVKEEFYILSKIREILLSGPIIYTGLGRMLIYFGREDFTASDPELRYSTKNIEYCKSLNGWVLRSSSVVKLKPLINYLLGYGLKTKKSLVFTQWCKIHPMVNNK